MEERGITRRVFLAIIPAFFLPKSVFGSNLQIKYITYRNELAIRVVAKNGESYSSMSQLYTGTERYTKQIKDFNDDRPVDKGDNYYIPVRFLRLSIRKVLAENKFSIYRIGQQGEGTIDTLSELAEKFLNDSFPILEKIAILLTINQDINPITKRVYPNQKILAPDSLIKRVSLEPDSKAEKVQPPIKQQIKKRQNPFRTDVDYIKKRLRERDLFGANRIRTGNGDYHVTKHTGIDLVASVGTPVYPIEDAVVLRAGKDNVFWRNGIIVEYRTNSGLVVMYLHLSEEYVKPGQNISASTVIGRVGITGNASRDNPHLHIQVKRNGKVVNPYSYVVVDS